MGLLTDIIKEIPHTAVLQEKVAAAESKYAALETENAILKDDKRALTLENQKLKKQEEKLSRKPDLHKIEIQIITLLAKHVQVSEMEIVVSLGVIPGTARHHLEQLMERHFVTKKSGMPCDSYELAKEGRVFASENHLIEYPASPDVS